MRERALDEFESIFERASIPVLDIRELDLKRVSTVLSGGELDESVLTLAGYLKSRFGAEIQLHWPAELESAAVKTKAGAHQFGLASGPFASTAELVGQVGIGRGQLVLLSNREQEHALDVDALVQGTQPPILFVRSKVPDPAGVFRNILHSLTGNFQQTQNFSYSFTLVDEHGRILLLHAIDAEEIQDVREALQVSPEVAQKSRRELLDALTHHGERYLKGVVAASRKMPYEVSYSLTVGDVVPAVQAELARGDYGLLVVGNHEEGHSRITADDYQLMHLVRDVPVLAL
jgi:hypothetical protein